MVKKGIDPRNKSYSIHNCKKTRLIAEFICCYESKVRIKSFSEKSELFHELLYRYKARLQ